MIEYDIISYDIISYYIILYVVILHYIVSYYIILYYNTLYHIILGPSVHVIIPPMGASTIRATWDIINCFIVN